MSRQITSERLRNPAPLSPRSAGGEGSGRNRVAQSLLTCLTAAFLVLLFAACAGEEPTTGREQPATTSSQSQADTDQPQSQPQAQPQPQAEARDEPSQSNQSTESTQAAAEQAPEQTREDTTQAAQPEERESAEQQDQPEPSDQPEQQQTAVGTGEVDLTVAPILGGYQFNQPIEMLALPDGSFLVAEQRGSITRFIEEDGEIRQFGILDLTEVVNFGGEQGLLSVALDPTLERESYLYVYYSPREAQITRLSRFLLVQGAALLASELVILEIRQPYSNHNGGAIRFGPDGMLYLGIGDGGAANDPHEHGQNLGTLLGTIIRIDVNDINTDTPYRIPADNPFVGVTGARPEIYAWGLRNPWRMAFDRETGDLWVGDVGQDRVEEIAIVRSGENHGWNIFEGDECFRSQDDCDALSNAVEPVATYTHDDGCSVTGGEVYHGRQIPQLRGHYLFGDYCSGYIWSIAPDGTTKLQLELDQRIVSFAPDNNGELYVLVFNGPILKLVAE